MEICLNTTSGAYFDFVPVVFTPKTKKKRPLQTPTEILVDFGKQSNVCHVGPLAPIKTQRGQNSSEGGLKAELSLCFSL